VDAARATTCRYIFPRCLTFPSQPTTAHALSGDRCDTTVTKALRRDPCVGLANQKTSLNLSSLFSLRAGSLCAAPAMARLPPHSVPSRRAFLQSRAAGLAASPFLPAFTARRRASPTAWPWRAAVSSPSAQSQQSTPGAEISISWQLGGDTSPTALHTPFRGPRV